MRLDRKVRENGVRTIYLGMSSVFECASVHDFIIVTKNTFSKSESTWNERFELNVLTIAAVAFHSHASSDIDIGPILDTE